ncbi:MAG: putative metalloprotease CJM1_0395 family protein [Candidatus Kapaibacterium sp.]
MAGHTIDGIRYTPYNMPVFMPRIGQKSGSSSSDSRTEERVVTSRANYSDSTQKTNSADDQDKLIRSEESVRRAQQENQNSDESGEITTTGQQLSDAEKRVIEELEDRDREVRTHEQAHQIAGGNLVRGKNFSYTTGPDGKRYAIGGEVQIDISKVPNDPRATIDKMQQVKRAALAPSDPSTQDRAVAARASQIEARARSEMRRQKSEGGEDSPIGDNVAKAAISAYKQSEWQPEKGSRVDYSAE